MSQSLTSRDSANGRGLWRGGAGAAPVGPGLLRGVPVPPALLMQGMGSLRLGSRAVMYTVETLPKGKNRVMGVSFGGVGGRNPLSPFPGDSWWSLRGCCVSGEELGLRHPPFPGWLCGQGGWLS